jgi:heme O synthase-like polyprenyltransferase
MYRQDYARAGCLVLPPGKSRSRFMAWQVLIPSVALLFLTLTPILLGKAGVMYL